jgi:Zn-dependent alcohol dehydrogenase
VAKKWVAVDFGSPDVLREIEVEVPAPRSGEVTITVRAAGMNLADYKEFAPGVDRSVLPLSIGFEVAGVISALDLAPVPSAGAVPGFSGEPGTAIPCASREADAFRRNIAREGAGRQSRKRSLPPCFAEWRQICSARQALRNSSALNLTAGIHFMLM